MKLKVTKGTTFEIEPGKKYVCMIAADTSAWTDSQKDELVSTLATQNITVAWLPEGAKFKLTEAPDAAATPAADKKA